MNKVYLLVLFSTLSLIIVPLKGDVFNKNLALLKSHNASKHKCSLKDGIINPPIKINTIVIDAGHGGHDPGCSGANSTEKHLALAVAKKFAAEVEAHFPSMTVILTRDKDVFIPLYERAAIANRAKADLFVSIHCNAMVASSATRGSETYVMGLHTAEHNLKVAKRENNAILLEADYEQNYDYDPNSPEGHILLSMYQNAFLEQSIQFAERVEHHFHATAERKSRGVKQAGFVVLKETAMPSALVEIGFLTNSSDETFLKTESGQNEVAKSLLNAFTDYKNKLEGGATPVASNYPPPQSEPRPSSTQQKLNNAHQAPVVPKPNYHQSTEDNFATKQHFNQPSTAQLSSNNHAPAQAQTPIVQPEKVIYSNNEHLQSTQATSIPAQERTMEPKGYASELSFSIQLAASPTPINTQQYPWTNIDQLIEIIQEDKLYKYQVKNINTLADADATRFRLQTAGFTDAFIVAYKNGKKITLDEAKMILKK